jgi:hypothetical protein
MVVASRSRNEKLTTRKSKGLIGGPAADLTRTGSQTVLTHDIWHRSVTNATLD